MDVKTEEGASRAELTAGRMHCHLTPLLVCCRACRCLILHQGRVDSGWEYSEEHDVSLEAHVRECTISPYLGCYTVEVRSQLESFVPAGKDGFAGPYILRG